MSYRSGIPYQLAGGTLLKAARGGHLGNVYNDDNDVGIHLDMRYGYVGLHERVINVMRKKKFNFEKQKKNKNSVSKSSSQLLDSDAEFLQVADHDNVEGKKDKPKLIEYVLPSSKKKALVLKSNNVAKSSSNTSPPHYRFPFPRSRYYDRFLTYPNDKTPKWDEHSYDEISRVLLATWLEMMREDNHNELSDFLPGYNPSKFIKSRLGLRIVSSPYMGQHAMEHPGKSYVTQDYQLWGKFIDEKYKNPFRKNLSELLDKFSKFEFGKHAWTPEAYEKFRKKREILIAKEKQKTNDSDQYFYEL